MSEAMNFFGSSASKKKEETSTTYYTPKRGEWSTTTKFEIIRRLISENNVSLFDISQIKFICGYVDSANLESATGMLLPRKFPDCFLHGKKYQFDSRFERDKELPEQIFTCSTLVERFSGSTVIMQQLTKDDFDDASRRFYYGWQFSLIGPDVLNLPVTAYDYFSGELTYFKAQLDLEEFLLLATQEELDRKYHFSSEIFAEVLESFKLQRIDSPADIAPAFEGLYRSLPKDDQYLRAYLHLLVDFNKRLLDGWDLRFFKPNYISYQKNFVRTLMSGRK